jgi:hypothetical protein
MVLERPSLVKWSREAGSKVGLRMGEVKLLVLFKVG